MITDTTSTPRCKVILLASEIFLAHKYLVSTNTFDSLRRSTIQIITALTLLLTTGKEGEGIR
jgi:hypothetical protein